MNGVLALSIVALIMVIFDIIIFMKNFEPIIKKHFQNINEVGKDDIELSMIYELRATKRALKEHRKYIKEKKKALKYIKYIVDYFEEEKEFLDKDHFHYILSRIRNVDKRITILEKEKESD